MTSRPFSDFSFEQYLGEGKLMGSRCAECRTVYVPPRSICPKCHGSTMIWEQVTASGRLAAFTVIAIGPPAMFEEGYNRDNPYCSGVIELDEKARVVARIEGVDAQNPDSIRIGMPMQAVFSDRGRDANQRTVLVFKPQPGSDLSDVSH